MKILLSSSAMDSPNQKNYNCCSINDNMEKIRQLLADQDTRLPILYIFLHKRKPEEIH